MKHEPITLETWADLLRHGYRVSVHCRACERHVMVDVGKMPQDKAYVGARMRCRKCGGKDCGMSLLSPQRSIQVES